MPASLFELIADPVRLAIVRRLSGHGEATLAEIAEPAGVHANTVRSHMAELEAAGVVERENAAPDGPGRPQVCYRLSPGWRLPSSDLAGMSELLAAMVIRLEPSDDDVDELGRQWGRFLSGRPGGDSMAELPRILERLGFDAEVDGREIRLRSCPCALIAPASPQLICGLAAAAIDGVLEADPRRLRVSSADHDPVARRCTIRLGQDVAAPAGRLGPDDHFAQRRGSD